jgi:acyl dehydratase
VLHFDDIAENYETTVGTWALTAADIIAFAEVWDPQPFHTDAVAAKQSPFGGLIASSAHLFAICTRLFFDQREPFAVRAMLGKDKLQLPNPARAGTTLTYRTRCAAKRQSASRPNVGIVVLADTVTDDAGNVVLSQEVTLMVGRRP